MYFKKMIGKKCYLSPISIDDADKYTEWLNDNEITQYLSLYPVMISLQGEKELLLSIAKGQNYAIIDLPTNVLIGNCGFVDIDTINRTAEVGIFIGNKDYLNKGYGKEALALLVTYGFNALNLRNIMLKVYSFNKRAIRCYENIGFKIIGKRRNAIERNQNIHDILFMDILYEDLKQ
jgi:RimJ/RimL family protein N-acetyltransferase